MIFIETGNTLRPEIYFMMRSHQALCSFTEIWKIFFQSSLQTSFYFWQKTVWIIVEHIRLPANVDHNLSIFTTRNELISLLTIRIRLPKSSMYVLQNILYRQVTTNSRKKISCVYFLHFSCCNSKQCLEQNFKNHDLFGRRIKNRIKS